MELPSLTVQRLLSLERAVVRACIAASKRPSSPHIATLVHQIKAQHLEQMRVLRRAAGRSQTPAFGRSCPVEVVHTPGEVPVLSRVLGPMQRLWSAYRKASQLGANDAVADLLQRHEETTAGQLLQLRRELEECIWATARGHQVSA